MNNLRFVNKELEFTPEEKSRLGIRGLYPCGTISLDHQVAKEMDYLRTLPTDLLKYIHLTNLQNRNETLFYKICLEHTTEITPLLYTPTVGEACIKYSKIFRNPRGLFISLNDIGHVKEILNNWTEPSVKVIVVTDGERILGLGDLGANGMGIPVGKLSLYTAFAGIDPRCCLPVTLDVGTNNKDNLADPYYIGLRQKRCTTPDYDQLVEEFIMAAHEKWGCLIQFEDFGNTNAFRLLAKYQPRVCTFNDDIQGTASVVVAGLLATPRVTGIPLKDHTFLFCGAGEAGTGIGQMIVIALMKLGLTNEEAHKRCWFVDSSGLVVASRKNLAHHKLEFAHEHDPVSTFDEAVKAIKPTALIGVSGVPNSFNQSTLEYMAQINKRPIVFALSNPTSQAECTAQQAYEWTNGTAVYASGSPFDPLTVVGKFFRPGQGNNAYIFPGVGLGVVATDSSCVTDEMFYIAAEYLSTTVQQEQIDEGCLYPPLTKIREVSKGIARIVAEHIFEKGYAKISRPADLDQHIQNNMYMPAYDFVVPSKI